MSLAVANYYLVVLWPLTSRLQEREIDIIAAYAKVNSLNKVWKMRDCQQLLSATVDTVHNDLFKRAVNLASYVNTAPSKPRICSRMMNWENHNTADAKTYYRVTITVPFLESSWSTKSKNDMEMSLRRLWKGFRWYWSEYSIIKHINQRLLVIPMRRWRMLHDGLMVVSKYLDMA